MANKDIEIEIKLPLKNALEVKKFLNKKGKLVARDIFQKDTYFVPIHRNFLDVKFPFEWLRLRESSKGFSLNYKHFYPENVKKTDYCDEYETKIDDVTVMKKILQSLDIKEIVTVEKTRTTWIFEGVEVVVDKVKNLGDFIELEAKTYFENPRDGKKLLFETLKKLNARVGEEDLRGYPFRILEMKGYKY
ncbi:class IV adenylate cyclase [Candidatus Woesebacteria bacterium]|nr:MAG: class IV adenylate cyclase [Candidatus Woesebacteria bacterium]